MRSLYVHWKMLANLLSECSKFTWEFVVQIIAICASNYKYITEGNIIFLFIWIDKDFTVREYTTGVLKSINFTKLLQNNQDVLSAFYIYKFITLLYFRGSLVIQKLFCVSVWLLVNNCYLNSCHEEYCNLLESNIYGFKVYSEKINFYVMLSLLLVIVRYFTESRLLGGLTMCQLHCFQIKERLWSWLQ